MSCSINKSRSSVVIDVVESRVKDKIEEIIFGNNHIIVMEKLRDYQEQFKTLGYEVEEAEFAGQWYWFRVHCKYDEIIKHVNRIKENLIV